MDACQREDKNVVSRGSSDLYKRLAKVFLLALLGYLDSRLPRAADGLISSQYIQRLETGIQWSNPREFRIKVDGCQIESFSERRIELVPP